MRLNFLKNPAEYYLENLIKKTPENYFVTEGKNKLLGFFPIEKKIILDIDLIYKLVDLATIVKSLGSVILKSFATCQGIFQKKKY